MRHNSVRQRINMKHILTRSTLALLISLIALPATYAASKAQQWDYLQPDRDQMIASLNVVELLKRHHYSKPPLDDARSRKMYAGYLKMLDPSRMYFTAQDIQEFNRWETQFDDFLKNGNLKPGYAIYNRQLTRQDQYLDYALEKLGRGIDAIDFTVAEYFETDREKADWAADEEALQDLWRKRLKDQILRLKIANKEPKAIEELLVKRYKNQKKRLLQTRSEDVFQSYINAFAQTYDPHTTYLSPDNAENFDINMSLSLEGIGAMLQGDNEHVKIVRLIPAGPAEKSKLVAPADKIIAVGQGKKSWLM